MSERKIALGNIECRPIQESDEFNGRTYEQGRADRTKEFQKQFDVLYADKMEQVRADERAKVIDELLDLDCKRDVTQDECDAYVSTSGCGQCKLNRILKKAEKLKEQSNQIGVK